MRQTPKESLSPCDIFEEGSTGKRNSDGSVSPYELNITYFDALNDPESLRGQVYRRILRLLDVRSCQPAFHPDATQEILPVSPAVFAIRRTASGGRSLLALHNVTDQVVSLCLTPWLESSAYRELIEGKTIRGDELMLQPYQTVWLQPVS